MISQINIGYKPWLTIGWSLIIIGQKFLLIIIITCNYYYVGKL